MRGFIDGPFGPAARAQCGDHLTVLLVAGGSGVRFALSVLENICMCMAGRDGRKLGGQPDGWGRRNFWTYTRSIDSCGWCENLVCIPKFFILHMVAHFMLVPICVPVYEAIINKYPNGMGDLVLLSLSMHMASEVVWHAIIRKNFGLLPSSLDAIMLALKRTLRARIPVDSQLYRSCVSSSECRTRNGAMTRQ